MSHEWEKVQEATKDNKKGSPSGKPMKTPLRRRLSYAHPTGLRELHSTASIEEDAFQIQVNRIAQTAICQSSKLACRVVR